MTLWLRVLVALLENQVQFSRPILGGSQAPVTQNPRYSHAILAPISACTHIKVK